MLHNYLETFRRGRFGAADSALRLFSAADSALRRFGAGHFGNGMIRCRPFRRGDFSVQFHFFTTINAWLEYRAGAIWVRCPERHTGIFFLIFFYKTSRNCPAVLETSKKCPAGSGNVKKLPRRVRNVKKLPRRVSVENRGLGSV